MHGKFHVEIRVSWHHSSASNTTWSFSSVRRWRSSIISAPGDNAAPRRSFQLLERIGNQYWCYCDDRSLKEKGTEPWAAQRISDILGHKIPIPDKNHKRCGHIGMGRASVSAPCTSDQPMKHLHICPSQHDKALGMTIECINRRKYGSSSLHVDFLYVPLSTWVKQSTKKDYIWNKHNRYI
jgi:hypothetical protein